MIWVDLDEKKNIKNSKKNNKTYKKLIFIFNNLKKIELKWYKLVSYIFL